MFKAAKAGPQKAITANRLDDGRVVFLDELAAGRTTSPRRFSSPTAPSSTRRPPTPRRQHDARVVVEPYAIDIAIVDGRPVPARMRERIRAEGPTVTYGEAEYRR